MNVEQARSGSQSPAPRWRLVLFVALSSLRANRWISALLVAAVAVGFGFQVPIDALLVGYRSALLREGIEHGEGAVRVRAPGLGVIEGADEMSARIAGYDDVTAVVPLLLYPAALRARGRWQRTAAVGIDPDAADVPYHLLEGRGLEASDPLGVVIGLELARKLGIAVGDEVAVHVVLASGPLPLADEDAIGRYRMTVRGIVAGAFGARKATFVQRRFLAQEGGLAGDATSLAIYARHLEQASIIRDRVCAQYPDLEVRTWDEDSQYIPSSLSAIAAIRVAVAVMIVCAVAIPVLALLYINVLHRRRDVGILTAIGLGRLEIFAAFWVHALLVAILALAVGLVIALGLIAWFTGHPIFEYEGLVILPMPTAASFLRPGLIVSTTVLLAGTLPAWLASRIDPARVLRGIA